MLQFPIAAIINHLGSARQKEFQYANFVILMSCVIACISW